MLTVSIERLAENDEQIRLVEFVESFYAFIPRFSKFSSRKLFEQQKDINIFIE